MKVTDPDVIKAGERDLIESIKDDLDWNVIKGVLLQKLQSSSFDIKNGALSFDVSGGEIVVHDGQIAFRVDFQLKTEMAIMFDRKGNYIPDGFPVSLYGDSPVLPDGDTITNDEYRLDGEHISDEYNTSPDELQDDDIDELGSDASSDDVEFLDDITLLEDEDILGKDEEDILGDMTDDQDAGELDPIADLNQLNQSDDDIEDILKESRDFWGTQEK